MVNVEELMHDMHSSTLNLDACDNDNVEFDMPITTKEQLEHLECSLREDGMLQQKLIKKLSLLGGKTTKTAVRKMLEALLSNDMMKAINWTGLCGKMAFRKMKCREIIQNAVRRNGRTAKATDDDIKNEVVIFLHGADDREGGKSRRLSLAKHRQT